MQAGIQALMSPVIISAVVIVVMMQIAFIRNFKITWLLSCAGILLAMLAIVPDINALVPQQITPLLVADQYSVFYSLLILLATLITALQAKDYLQNRSGENEEFCLLLLLSALGGLILVSATHLASLLLGMELLGVALYALIAYPERGHPPLEASIKYLVLSGAASAVLLFGFALIYAALGTLSFAEIGEKLLLPRMQNNHVLILAGTALIFTGISFKLSLVPFHMWTPDVYQGAPAPVTGFLATVSKGAIFAAVMRLFIDARLYQYQGLMIGLSFLAVASMLAGNLLALQQNNLKRLLAYSSIAHLGYLLITLVVFGSLDQPELAVEAAGYYLTAYLITSLAAFAVVTILSSNESCVELDELQDIRGLFWTRPLLAVTLMIAMLSLAGIPLTVGFIGKFYLFTAGIEGSLWLLLAALVIGSGIGIYYYLRIIFTMTKKATDDEVALLKTISPSIVAKVVLSVLIVLMLYLGVMPQSLIDYLGNISTQTINLL